MRPLRPQDNALLAAFIVLIPLAAALLAAAHTVGWHRWCTHPPRHHTHTGPTFPRCLPDD